MDRTERFDPNDINDDGYVLLAFLSNNVRNIITNMLADINEEIGEGLWIMPDQALHITLCEIFQPKPYAENKQTFFAAHKQMFEDGSAQIFKNIKPVAVHFNKVVVSPQAITIQGTDDGSFNAIRKQLVETLPLPSETKLPPNIIHSSIARFTQELDVNRVRQIVDKHFIDYVEVVNQFQLVHNIKPPLLDYATIRTYPLA